MIYQYNRALSGTVSLYLKGLFVLPHTTYRFSADVLGDSFVFYISKRGIPDGNRAYTTPKTSYWTTVSFEFTTGNDEQLLSKQFSERGISLIRTGFSAQEAENTYVDNVSLVEVDKPSFNIIDGGTFEEKRTAIYEKNWNPEILGLSGKTHGVAIVPDPLDANNHCLLLPKDLVVPKAPSSLPAIVTQFRRYRKNETEIADYIVDTGNDFLILFPQKGEIRAVVNDTLHTVTPGTMLVIPPGSSMQVIYLAGHNTDYFYFRFNGEEACSLMKSIGLDQPCTPALSDVNAFADLIIKMLHLSPRSQSYFYALSGLAMLFLSELEMQITAGETPFKYRYLIEKITEAMQEHPEIAISNDQLAKECGVSKSHFINLFKRYTGHTPKQYRIHELIRKACVLLDTTTLNIQEISFSLDMEDPLYFSRLFKSVQGVSPREYRRSHRAKHNE